MGLSIHPHQRIHGVLRQVAPSSLRGLRSAVKSTSRVIEGDRDAFGTGLTDAMAGMRLVLLLEKVLHAQPLAPGGTRRT